jgi:hypothetical protein
VGATSDTNALNSVLELCLDPTGDDHLGTFDGQLPGDRKANAASRSGDECRLVIELQINGGNSVLHFTMKQLFSGFGRPT